MKKSMNLPRAILYLFLSIFIFYNVFENGIERLNTFKSIVLLILTFILLILSIDYFFRLIKK